VRSHQPLRDIRDAVGRQRGPETTTARESQPVA